MELLERHCRFYRIHDFSIYNQLFSFWYRGWHKENHFCARLTNFYSDETATEASGEVLEPLEFAGHAIQVDLAPDRSFGYFTFMSGADLYPSPVCLLITDRQRRRVDSVLAHVTKVTPRVFEAISVEGYLLLRRVGTIAVWGPNHYCGQLHKGEGLTNVYL